MSEACVASGAGEILVVKMPVKMFLKRSCLAETLSAQQALKHFVMNDSDMYLIATEFPEFFTTLSAVVLRYMR
eukprot:jgi/Bigna1/62347/fgenesh1_kg.34_\